MAEPVMRFVLPDAARLSDSVLLSLSFPRSVLHAGYWDYVHAVGPPVCIVAHGGDNGEE